MTDQKKESTLPENNSINIWLDSYDDLFSDFDPRPYGERSMSDDFILHARKISRDVKSKSIYLKLLLPENVRNAENEKTISKRLNHHFIGTWEQLRDEKKHSTRRGIIFIATGILLMIAGSIISYFSPQYYYSHLLLIFIEPSGWFLFWTGLDQLITFSQQTKKEFEFYDKMKGAAINFGSY